MRLVEAKRSYSNRKSEQISVTQEHLDTAIRIKLELQKASPSRNCSWAQHKRMMIEEGFEDSDSNNSYRCMILREQRERGEFSDTGSYIFNDNETVQDTLNSVQRVVGDIKHTKLEMQQESRELNKVKRQLSSDLIFAKAISESISKMKIEKPVREHVIKKSSNSKSMIAFISDLHFGAEVDIEGYVYNPEVSEQLMMDYADKLIEIIVREQISDLIVVNLGDMVEGLYMRKSQSYNMKTLFAEQIGKATNIIVNFLLKLSDYTEVEYRGINGNHDRINGDKNDSIYGDGAVSVSNVMISSIIKYAGLDIKFVDSEPYHTILDVNGVNILAVHGDKTPLKRNSVLAEQSDLYSIPFDLLVGGHFHRHSLLESGEDRYVVIFGSLKGSDEYSLKQLGLKSSRSQGVVIVDDKSNFEIRQIKFK